VALLGLLALPGLVTLLTALVLSAPPCSALGSVSAMLRSLCCVCGKVGVKWCIVLSPRLRLHV
jgi:hypothetical protein